MIVVLSSLLFLAGVGFSIPYNGMSAGVASGGLFSAFSPMGDDSSTSNGGSSQSSNAEMKCTPYYDTVYDNKCQSYTDRVCTTQHQENCFDVPGETCKAILASKQEDVEYEVIQATVTVQNCHKVNERVCDTVYKTQFTNKDDYKCIELANVDCSPHDKVIQDKTCKTTTEFDCKEIGFSAQTGLDDGSLGSSGLANALIDDESSSGMLGSSYGRTYKVPSATYGYREPPKVVCKKSAATKCYNTPRTISSEKCEMQKRVCDLEQRPQPKQVKKYVYSKQCRPIRRTICENADVKDLVQSCAPYTHKSCSYTPREKCVDVPKEHCYKVGKSVQKQKCETVVNEGSYSAANYRGESSFNSGGSQSMKDSVFSSDSYRVGEFGSEQQSGTYIWQVESRRFIPRFLVA
ncbi:unnamed protein product [Lepeophtheirus salmonis]|uniref:(salmon louse) hypothetical protein n=1 Tax=Lepeophtheirus salmonis TaxID=72036 RepID=A0A7R8CK45_LEPSM|nr:unnamed protein product [Lepeophtheirus salmonis]CAF2817398.1 unnamed protein product [Lepeophtheirus salmonis]